MQPFPIEVDHSMEALPPDSRIRQVYPEDLFENGAYAPLPYGRVRYWIIGPEDGKKVVLIHGVSTPGCTWMKIGPYLVAKGFRVLIYDLYGKGYSEAPKVPSSPTLFAVQLALLMQYIRWDSARIVGFSMGGGVAAAFASSLPHLVDEKVVFISSAGLIERAKTLHVPSRDRVPLVQYKELRDLQASGLPGYQRSLKSCFNDGPLFGLESAFDKLAKVTVGSAGVKPKFLIVHGTDDGVVSVEEADKIKARLPEAEVVKIDGAGHDVVVRDKHWEILAHALATFLA